MKTMAMLVAVAMLAGCATRASAPGFDAPETVTFDVGATFEGSFGEETLGCSQRGAGAFVQASCEADGRVDLSAPSGDDGWTCRARPAAGGAVHLVLHLECERAKPR